MDAVFGTYGDLFSAEWADAFLSYFGRYFNDFVLFSTAMKAIL